MVGKLEAKCAHSGRAPSASTQGTSPRRPRPSSSAPPRSCAPRRWATCSTRILQNSAEFCSGSAEGWLAQQCSAARLPWLAPAQCTDPARVPPHAWPAHTAPYLGPGTLLIVQNSADVCLILHTAGHILRHQTRAPWQCSKTYLWKVLDYGFSLRLY